MTESSIFWDTSGGGDGGAEYTQAQLVAWLRRTHSPTPASEGVLKGYSNELAVTGASSPVSVAAGAASVYGFPYESTGALSLVVATPSVGTTGGHVVLRVDWSAQTVRLVAVRNTDGISSAPAVTQVANTTWEIRLYTFTITTGGVIALTDARTYCHFATAVKTAMLEDSAVTAVKIANRTRTVIVAPIGAYDFTAAAALDGGGFGYEGFELVDSHLSQVYGAAFVVPKDFVSGMTVQALIIPNATGNLYHFVSAQWGASGGDAAASSAGGSYAAQASPGVGKWMLSTALAVAPAVDNIMRLIYSRDATNGSDTVSNYVDVFGFLITYTADS